MAPSLIPRPREIGPWNEASGIHTCKHIFPSEAPVQEFQGRDQVSLHANEDQALKLQLVELKGYFLSQIKCLSSLPNRPWQTMPA